MLQQALQAKLLVALAKEDIIIMIVMAHGSLLKCTFVPDATTAFASCSRGIAIPCAVLVSVFAACFCRWQKNMVYGLAYLCGVTTCCPDLAHW